MMSIGIRGKLVALLTAVALLPLLAALLTIVIGGSQLRTETFAQTLLSVAASEGRGLETSLRKDVEKVLVIVDERTTSSVLARRTSPMSLADRGALDRAWPDLPDDDPRVRSVLDSFLAQKFRLMQEEDPRLAEIFVTDRFGEVVAATGKTSDYYQGDESWWRRSFDEGRGRAVIMPIAFDRSANVWSVDLCVPVHVGDEVVGVAKAVLDLTGWISQTEGPVGKHSASLALARRDGWIIYDGQSEPLTARVGQWEGPLVEGFREGWRVNQDEQIQSFYPIELPSRVGRWPLEAPSWMLVLSISESLALAPVYRLSVRVLIVGLLLIGAIFLAGIMLVDRSIIRRVRRLERATHSVARGDLSHRIESGWAGRRLLGADEIDDLAQDFNRMLEQVQKSHDELTTTDRMRTSFIRIAGHELRTPVSYIMGTASLLKDNTDPVRLRRAIASVGARAKQLSEMIKAMFKLLPDHGQGEALHCEYVPIVPLLEEVYLDCQPFVESRGQRLLIETDRKDGVAVQADRAKLRDVIENLVTNAIKFTPDGGTVRVTTDRELGGHIAIAVHDQGPGVPDADLPHIFEPFYIGGDDLKHSSGRTGHQKRGMGLGLAVVRYFVELHGGAVRVLSSPQGTTFTVTIPIEPPIRGESMGPK